MKVSIDTSSEMTASGWYIPFQNLPLIYVFICAHRVMMGPLNRGVSPLCHLLSAPVLTCPSSALTPGAPVCMGPGQTARARLPPSDKARISTPPAGVGSLG